MYHIIEKVEWLDDNAVRTTLGYVPDNKEGLQDFISIEMTHGLWIYNHREELESGEITLGAYLSAGPIYISPSTTSIVDKMGLNEIDDLKNPEGVKWH